MNLTILLITGLIPLVVGMIWYHEKVFGKAWMETSGTQMPEEKPGMMDMMKIFIPVYIFSVLYGFILMSLCVHQWGAIGMVGGDVTTAKESYHVFMSDYGTAFRTLKHGALHGLLASLALSLFYIGTSALFERRSWKYILIQTGFNIVCSVLMGAVICGYGPAIP